MHLPMDTATAPNVPALPLSRTEEHTTAVTGPEPSNGMSAATLSSSLIGQGLSEPKLGTHIGLPNMSAAALSDSPSPPPLGQSERSPGPGEELSEDSNNTSCCRGSNDRLDADVAFCPHFGHPPPRGHEFKGVRRRKASFIAEIRDSVGKRIWLGSHKSAERAAEVYDEAARILHGRHGYLNFPTAPRCQSLLLPADVRRVLMQHRRAVEPAPDMTSLLRRAAPPPRALGEEATACFSPDGACFVFSIINQSELQKHQQQHQQHQQHQQQGQHDGCVASPGLGCERQRGATGLAPSPEDDAPSNEECSQDGGSPMEEDGGEAEAGPKYDGDMVLITPYDLAALGCAGLPALDDVAKRGKPGKKNLSPSLSTASKAVESCQVSCQVSCGGMHKMPKTISTNSGSAQPLPPLQALPGGGHNRGRLYLAPQGAMQMQPPLLGMPHFSPQSFVGVPSSSTLTSSEGSEGAGRAASLSESIYVCEREFLHFASVGTSDTSASSSGLPKGSEAASAEGTCQLESDLSLSTSLSLSGPNALTKGDAPASAFRAYKKPDREERVSLPSSVQPCDYNGAFQGTPVEGFQAPGYNGFLQALAMHCGQGAPSHGYHPWHNFLSLQGM